MNATPETYEATAYGPGDDAEALPGRFVIGQYWLRFNWSDGFFELPWQDLEIEFPEAGDPRVLFRHPRYADWTFAAADREILQQRVFAQRTNLRNQIAEVQERKEGWRRVRVTAYFLVGFAALSLIGLWLGGFAVGILVNVVPVSVENKIGDGLLEDMKAESQFADAPETRKQLDSLIARLQRGLPRSEYRFQVHLLEHPDPNAVALPGGHIIVFSGLTNVANSPEELAGVLAHEMAHVTRRHGLRAILANAGPAVALKVLFGNDDSLLAAVATGSYVLMAQSFSREHEREADEEAWSFLVAARIDPRGLAEFLKRLKEFESRDLQGRLALRSLSSHPPTEERIRRLEEKWNGASVKPTIVPLDRPAR